MLLYAPEECLLHEMQPRHPERPDRLRAIQAGLQASGLADACERRSAPPVSAADLAEIHASPYLAELNAALTDLNAAPPESGLMQVDGDTAMCPHSLHAAALAAGAVVDAVAEVLATPGQRAFCAVRPPGHHAEADAAMGFCFYNSIALGAERALRDLQRAAVLDFDVHHGNGTVDIFKDRPEVLVCSSFQHPFYPNRYVNIDRPNIVNTPLPAGAKGPSFRQAVERDWSAALKAHRPEIILVSAGFDAHREDPLGGLLLHDEDFLWVTEFIVDQAATHAEGRIVSALEGGYDLNALSRCAALHVEALIG